MQFPAPVMWTVSPVIVQFPDTIEKLTSSPEVAVALTWKSGSPNVWSPTLNVMVWSAFSMSKDRSTSAAAL